MPDVGVLNLTIKDNSEQAAQGLTQLAGALSAVRQAVSGGLRLSGVANQVKRLADEINKINAATFIKLRSLRTSLEGLNGLGDIRITINDDGSVNRIRESIEATRNDVDGIAEGFERVSGGVSNASEEFETFHSRLRETASLMQHTNWTAGADQFAEMFGQWSRMRSMFSLGSGEHTGLTIRPEETGWTEWKNGAIEVEGTVSDANDKIQLASESMGRLLEGATGIESTVPTIASGFSQVNESIESANTNTNEWEQSCAKALEDARALNQYYAEATRQVPQTFEDIYNSEGLRGMQLRGEGTQNEQLYQMQEVARQFGMTVDEVRQRVEELNAARAQMAQPVDSALIQSAGGAYAALDRVTSEAERANGALGGTAEACVGAAGNMFSLAEAANHLGERISRMFPTLTGMINRFGAIARYRALRYVLKAISEGFREGVENVYKYSSAIGSSFAPAMDSASSAMAQMKNSIGAAAMPAIQALIPVLQTVVSWVIAAVNALNQLFALLRGQATWTRATNRTVKAFDDQKKAAQGAGGAIKDLLADWDELNIIQSDAGGGGGGGSMDAAEEYLSMFEEVNKFSNTIQRVVEEIKDRFGSVLNLVGLIGAGILAWRLSNGLTGALAMISGLIGTGITLYMVFQLTGMFDDLYLETGDPGWLIGNILTTLIGAVLAERFLNVVLGGAGATIAIPLTFAVSAIADIVANVGHSDIGALAPESLMLDLVTALKGGAIAGYLAYMVGGTLGDGILGGAIGLLATFGVALGIKADAQISEEGLTEEDILAKILSIVGLAGAGAATGAAVGHTVEAAVGMGMLFAGAPIATFGVAVGINAINTVVDARQITPEVIRKNLLAGGLVGAGLALIGGSLFGGTVAVIAGVGGAALTIGALFAIEAILAASPKEIKWGDYSATEAEIRAFVQSEMFSVDVETTINLLNSKVEATEAEKGKIMARAEALLPPMNVIRLGLATDETYADLKTQLFGEGLDGEGGLIGDLRNYAKEQKSLIETTFTLIPVVDEAGAVDPEKTADYLSAGLTGWSEVESYMTDIGTRLSDALKKGSVDGLDGYDDELILKLTTELQSVQNALTQAQSSSAMSGAILSGLSQMDQKSAMAVINLFKEEQEKLRASAESALTEELSSYNSLAAFYRTRGQEGDETKAAQFDAMAEELIKNWSTRLNAAIRNASAPGREIIASALTELVSIEPDDIRGKIRGTGNQSELFATIVEQIYKNQDVSPNSANKKYLQNLLYNYMYTMVSGLYEGDDLRAIQYAIQGGVLGFGDLFTEEAITAITNEFKNNSDYGNIIGDLLLELWSNSKVSKDQVQEVVEPVAEEVANQMDEVMEGRPGGSYGIQKYTETMNEVKTSSTETSAAVTEAVATMSGQEVGAVGITAFVESLQSMLANAIYYVNATLAEMSRINGIKTNNNNMPRYGGGGGKNIVAQLRAGGGPIKSGDLIMANENGRIEMMGTMGTQPVVANNQQIIEGISQGVASAQNEQNALLRRQNDLLMQILNKKMEAVVKPTSALGRANSRSAAMYDRVTG